jgi:hypothetical protein
MSLNYNQYSAIADLPTFQFTAAHALGMSVSTSRCLVADLNTETITLNHYEIFLPFLIQSPWTADSLNSDLRRLSSPVLSPLWSSLLAANTISFFSLGILLTYVDASRARTTENMSRDRYPLLGDVTALHRKHMSRDRYSASPSAHCFLPNTDHIENTSRDLYPLFWCDVTAHVPATRTQRKHCCCIVGRVCVAGVA